MGRATKKKHLRHKFYTEKQKILSHFKETIWAIVRDSGEEGVTKPKIIESLVEETIKPFDDDKSLSNIFLIDCKKRQYGGWGRTDQMVRVFDDWIGNKVNYAINHLVQSGRIKKCGKDGKSPIYKADVLHQLASI